jgi:hypothetical protein
VQLGVLVVARRERNAHSRGLGAELLECHAARSELVAESGIEVTVPEVLA